MTSQKKGELIDFSREKLRREVSKEYFWKNTHKEFRTLMDENIVSPEVYGDIEKQALGGKITEYNLFKHLQKDLKLQAADAHKIIDALIEKLTPAPEYDTSEEDLAKRQEMIRAIIASAYEEEQREAA